MPGGSRIPLQVLIVEAKRQPTEFVSPDKVGRAVSRELHDDIRNGIISRRV
jgi:hypothetical protein